MREELNWLKDVGIAALVVYMLGRILLRVVQASVEFFQAVREDNKERNSHFRLLLDINDRIAGQIELTRQAIEHITQVNRQQSHSIRLGTTELSSIHQDLLESFQSADTRLAEQVTSLSTLLGNLSTEITELHARLDAESTASGIQLADTTTHLLKDITAKLDDTQSQVARAIAQQVLSIVSKLEMLTEQIRQTQQVILLAVEGKEHIKPNAISPGQVSSENDKAVVSQP